MKYLDQIQFVVGKLTGKMKPGTDLDKYADIIIQSVVIEDDLNIEVYEGDTLDGEPLKFKLPEIFLP